MNFVHWTAPWEPDSSSDHFPPTPQDGRRFVRGVASSNQAMYLHLEGLLMKQGIREVRKKPTDLLAATMVTLPHDPGGPGGPISTTLTLNLALCLS